MNLAVQILKAFSQTILDKDTVNLPAVTADQSALSNILSLVWKILGALSLIFVVIGGFKYTLSGGDSNQVNSAKNTILYALVGLAISLGVFLIVNFVISKV